LVWIIEKCSAEFERTGLNMNQFIAMTFYFQPSLASFSVLRPSNSWFIQWPRAPYQVDT
jgi:hypothetical protein